VIGVDWAFATEGVDPAMAGAFTAALALLEEMGARIRPIAFPDSQAMQVMPLLTAEVGAAHEATFPSRADQYGPSLSRMLQGAVGLGGVHVANAVNARLRFNGALAKVFEQVDVIAMPTLPRGAPTWEEIGVMGEDMMGMMANLMRYTLPFDMSGSPTLSVPCGFDALGLPLSLQLIGRHLSESVICRAGHAYQMATDFHTRRPPLS
jgi:amidase